jgi:DNA repair protein RecO (recombination protein O)
MTDERASGIILRTRPLTETSLIVHWLTPDLGRLATVAKGARRPKSPFRGKLDLFYRGEFSFARSKRSELHTLREVSLLETHADLRRDLSWLEQVSYCAALIEQSTESETPLPRIFCDFTSMVGEISKHAASAQTVFAFEIKFLDELGLKPDFAETKLSAGAKQILERFIISDWAGNFRMKLSAAQIAELRQFLHGFLIYHLERIPAGRSRAVSGV